MPMNFSPLQRKLSELHLLTVPDGAADSSVLRDVVEDAVARLLVLQPLADEDAGRGRVELAAAEHAVPVPHAVLEGSIVDFSAGIPVEKTRSAVKLKC